MNSCVDTSSLMQKQGEPQQQHGVYDPGESSGPAGKLSGDKGIRSESCTLSVRTLDTLDRRSSNIMQKLEMEFRSAERQ